MTDPSNDDDRKARLEALEAKLAEKRALNAPHDHMEEHYSQAQHAWRMVIELVAGLGIGFGIGYGLDALFGTKPFLLVTFTLLGFAAGVNVMIRSARELATDDIGHAVDTDEDEDGD